MNSRSRSRSRSPRRSHTQRNRTPDRTSQRYNNSYEQRRREFAHDERRRSDYHDSRHRSLNKTSYKSGNEFYSRRSPARSSHKWENEYQSPQRQLSENAYNVDSFHHLSQEHSKSTRKPHDLPEAREDREPEFAEAVKQYFFGPEGTVVDLNELKKISVEIRRSLPRGVVPVVAKISNLKFDPEDVIVVRRPGEGSKPIFDRDELHPKVVEERVIKMDKGQETLYEQPEEPLPVPEYGRKSEEDLRARLVEKRQDSYSETSHHVAAHQERLDPWKNTNSRINYFEHDNRERFNRGRRGRPFNSAGPYRGRRTYRGRQRSPNWKHDLYDSIDDKPSSTTVN